MAIFATARKLATHVYRLLRYGQPYVDIGQDAYEEAFEQRRIKALHASAAALGCTVVPSSGQPEHASSAG